MDEQMEIQKAAVTAALLAVKMVANSVAVTVVDLDAKSVEQWELYGAAKTVVQLDKMKI
jgi:hypothetical protein